MSKNSIAYLLASFLGFISFIPWIVIVFVNQSSAQSMTNWSGKKVSVFSLFSMWVGNISRIFIDFGLGSNDSFQTIFPFIPLILFVFLLSIYGVYFLLRHTRLPVWWFILTLMVVPFGILLLPDLILGGRRSGVARYLIPIYLGIQIAVAYLLTKQLTNPMLSQKWQKFWQTIMVTILSFGIVSCIISLPAQIWWNKGPSRTQYIPQVTKIVNQGLKPLLISDVDHAQIQTLGHLLNANVSLQLVSKLDKILQIYPEFSEIYVYKPSKPMKQKLARIENSTQEWMPNTGKTLLRLNLPELTQDFRKRIRYLSIR